MSKYSDKKKRQAEAARAAERDQWREDHQRMVEKRNAKREAEAEVRRRKAASSLNDRELLAYSLKLAQQVERTLPEVGLVMRQLCKRLIAVTMFDGEVKSAMMASCKEAAK